MAERKSKKSTESRTERKQSNLIDNDDRVHYPQLARIVDLLDHQYETTRLAEDRRLYGDTMSIIFTLLDLLNALENGEIETYERAKEDLINYMYVHPPELGKEI